MGNHNDEQQRESSNRYTPGMLERRSSPKQDSWVNDARSLPRLRFSEGGQAQHDEGDQEQQNVGERRPREEDTKERNENGPEQPPQQN